MASTVGLVVATAHPDVILFPISLRIDPQSVKGGGSVTVTLLCGLVPGLVTLLAPDFSDGNIGYGFVRYTIPLLILGGALLWLGYSERGQGESPRVGSVQRS